MPTAAAPTTQTATQVADHYNKRQNTMRTTMGGAEILGARNMNNFIKSCLLGHYLSPNCSVLDIACGKGGDMAKFRAGRIAHYVGVDIAKASVEHAIDRYNAEQVDYQRKDSKPYPFTARFLAGDCFATDLASHLPIGLHFDVVSCQFAIHYAFESEMRARQALRNMASRLQPGGHLVGTTVDSDVLLAKLRASHASATPGQFGNKHFRVMFDPEFVGEGKVESALKRNPFGLRYMFTLDSAVENVPEWLVPKAVLVSLAEAEGLQLVRWANFHDFFEEESGPQMDLLHRMRVFQAESDFRHTEAEWEVSYLYTVFAFQKVAPPGPRMKAMHPGKPIHSRVDKSSIIECASLPIEQTAMVPLSQPQGPKAPAAVEGAPAVAAPLPRTEG